MRSYLWGGILGAAWSLAACSGQIGPDGNGASGGSPAAVGSDGEESDGAGSADDALSTGGAPIASGSGGTSSGGGDAPGSAGGVGGAATGGNAADGGGTASGGDTGMGGGDMALLPGGTFFMGGDDGNASSPRHERTLEAFLLDRTEVTAGAYDLCVTAGACAPADATGLGVNPGVAGYEDYPANYVTLRQAEAYCAWVGKRLPTEAEWEYAAGGLQGFEYPWGNAPPGGCIVGFLDPTPAHADQDHGCAVGQFPANENGLWDMGGGVYEYTSSPYCSYDAYSDTGYVPGCQADDYALRDGAFTSFAKELAQVTNRQPVPEDFTHQAIGFRCAATP